MCHLQHKLIGVYNRDEKCLQRGMDWVFKLSGLCFVFNGVKVLAIIVNSAVSSAANKTSNTDVWLTVHRSSMRNKKPTRCHLVDKQRTYIVTTWRVSAAIVAVEDQ